MSSKVAGANAGSAGKHPAQKPSRGVIRPPAAVKALPKPRQFTGKQLESMRLQFMLIDTNQDGQLDREEMSRFSKLYGINPGFVPLAFLLFDKNGNNLLSLDEYLEFMAVAADFDRNKRGFYRRVFDAIDVNHSGVISPTELQQFCTYMGGNMSEAEAVAVVKSMDYTGLGKLTWDDLCHWLGLPRGN
jgi:Ca2+-binding EF-hand superfamily protein